MAGWWNEKKIYGIDGDNKCRVEVFPEYRLGRTGDVISIRESDRQYSYRTHSFDIALPSGYLNSYDTLFPISCKLCIGNDMSIYHDVNSPEIKEIFEYIDIRVVVTEKRLQVKYKVNPSYFDTMPSGGIDIDLDIAYMWL